MPSSVEACPAKTKLSAPIPRDRHRAFLSAQNASKS